MGSSNLSVARGVFAVTPHDTNKLPASARALYVGVGGDIAPVAADGSSAVFKDVPQGSIFPVECTGVLATGTTASWLVGLK